MERKVTLSYYWYSRASNSPTLFCERYTRCSTAATIAIQLQVSDLRAMAAKTELSTYGHRQSSSNMSRQQPCPESVGSSTRSFCIICLDNSTAGAVTGRSALARSRPLLPTPAHRQHCHCPTPKTPWEGNHFHQAECLPLLCSQ